MEVFFTFTATASLFRSTLLRMQEQTGKHMLGARGGGRAKKTLQFLPKKRGCFRCLSVYVGVDVYACRFIRIYLVIYTTTHNFKRYSKKHNFQQSIVFSRPGQLLLILIRKNVRRFRVQIVTSKTLWIKCN